VSSSGGHGDPVSHGAEPGVGDPEEPDGCGSEGLGAGLGTSVPQSQWTEWRTS